MIEELEKWRKNGNKLIIHDYCIKVEKNGISTINKNRFHFGLFRGLCHLFDRN